MKRANSSTVCLLGHWSGWYVPPFFSSSAVRSSRDNKLTEIDSPVTPNPTVTKTLPRLRPAVLVVALAQGSGCMPLFCWVARWRTGHISICRRMLLGKRLLHSRFCFASFSLLLYRYVLLLLLMLLTVSILLLLYWYYLDNWVSSGFHLFYSLSIYLPWSWSDQSRHLSISTPYSVLVAGMTWFGPDRCWLQITGLWLSEAQFSIT